MRMILNKEMERLIAAGKKSNIIVMKFGGSSVSTPEKILKVRDYLKISRRKGVKIIVVVSAMGDETDELVELARQIDDHPDPQEMDKLLSTGETKTAALLAIALKKIGVKARSVGAGQIGLETTSRFGGAKIKTIKNPGMLKQNPDEILIVAGFQGIAEGTADLTTLGRGGSDATAIAIAAAVKAKVCKIFTGVDGVYEVDPGLVPNAKRFPTINYDLMITMAAAGAGVMMDRSVKIAQAFNIPIHVLLSPSIGISTGGTLITNSFSGSFEAVEKIASIAIIKNVSVITIRNVRDVPGKAAEIFKMLSSYNLLDAVQGQVEERLASISIIVNNEADKISQLMETAYGKHGIFVSKNLAYLTVVDQLMKEGTGYFYQITEELAKNGINIKTINSGQTSISVSIAMADLEKAARALAQELKLTE